MRTIISSTSLLKTMLFSLIYLSTQASAFNYGEALQKSIFFYEAQQSGKIPDWNRVSWRGDSALNDGADSGHDLSGGWYDAGDHVKFGLPMASSATLLAWGAIEYPEAYVRTNQLKHLKNNLRFVANYFIKAHTAPNEFYAQVGNGGIDHAWWGSAEVMQMKRPSFKIDETCPGSEVAGETAAALSAIAILFKDDDPTYASTLLMHAEQLFSFADTYRGKYSECITDAQSYYNSFSGYEDELAWSAIWLYRATKKEKYLSFAIDQYKNLNLEGQTQYKSYRWAHAWDDKAYGVYILMAKITGEDIYRKDTERWLDYWSKGFNGEQIKYTPGGLAFLDDWGPTRYAANTAFLSLVYADYLFSIDPNSSKAKGYYNFSVSQIEYILGKNPNKISYLIGYSDNHPKNPHHRTAHGTWTNNLNTPNKSRHLLVGALVGGPLLDDSYEDDRGNFISNEVATDYNAGFTSAAARLYLDFGGDPIPESLFPQKETPKNEYFIEAKLNSKGSRHIEITARVFNHSAWPARVNEDLHFRYWVDLSEVFAKGYSLSDVKVTTAYSQASKVSQLVPWGDNEKNIYYIDASFKGIKIYPGGLSASRAEVQFRIALSPNTDSSIWDNSNDPSWMNYSNSYQKPTNIALYAGDEIVWGTEPTPPCGQSTGVNCTPITEDLNKKGEINTPLNIKLTGKDSDGTITKYDITKAPSFGSIDLTGSIATYTPSQNFLGKDSFEYIAFDNKNTRSTPSTVTIEVVDSNAPSLKILTPSSEQTLMSNEAFIMSVEASNIDTFRVTLDSFTKVYSTSSKNISLTAPETPGTYSIILSALDEEGTKPLCTGSAEVSKRAGSPYLIS